MAFKQSVQLEQLVLTRTRFSFKNSLLK